jgi:hypothetical protein
MWMARSSSGIRRLTMVWCVVGLAAACGFPQVTFEVRDDGGAGASFVDDGSTFDVASEPSLFVNGSRSVAEAGSSGSSEGSISVGAESGRAAGGPDAAVADDAFGGRGSGSGDGASSEGRDGNVGSGSSSGGPTACACDAGKAYPTSIHCAAISMADPSAPPTDLRRVCNQTAGFLESKLGCGQQGTYVTCDATVVAGALVCAVASQVPMMQQCLHGGGVH